MFNKKTGKMTLLIFMLALFSMTFLFRGFNLYAIDLKQEIIVLGSGLNEAQKTQTLNLLGVDTDLDYNINIVTGDDAERYINLHYADEDMISSVLVEFLETNSGVSTKISTPDNITKIKEYQYSNAAITSGIYDTRITVGAPHPVTGESALTGVYKAAEIYGIELDAQKLEAGNDELITVRIIDDNNATNDDYDSEEFSKALTEIKVQLTELVDEKGKESVSVQEITVIINKVLNKYEINISQADIDRLTATLEKFKNTITAEDIDRILEQLKSFGEETWDLALDFIDRAQSEGWWDQVVQFFVNLFQAIADFFSQLFNRN